MDETTATIKYGCRLARDLEENIDNMVNQPQLLSRSCDEIIRVFSHVKERISYANVVLDDHDQRSQQQLEVASGLHQEWLPSGQTQTQPILDDHLLRAQPQPLGSWPGAFGVHGRLRPEMAAPDKMKGVDQQQEQAGGSFVEMGGRDDVQPMQVSSASRDSSSSQRQRRRRNEDEKKTVRLPAPRMGNTEIPPDDGYTWRKYGQKDILNSKFPRSYFRCTHQKLYKCGAKKQVQRLDDDPSTFEVTYRGEHTCHLSSTAPSVPPSQSLQLRQDVIPQAAVIVHPPAHCGPANFVPLSHWLSIDNIGPPAGEGTNSITSGMQMYRNFGLATVGTSNSGAGPSTAAAQFGDYQPLADMADAMFNSGSSSTNSMDLIFSSMDEKWDSGEKKN